MEIQLWSDVAVEVSTVFAAAKPIQTITKASPGVVGATAHGCVIGDFILLKDIKGMNELDYAVAKVGTVPTVDSLQLAGIDTTLFKTFLSGSLQKITFGVSAASFTEITASGGVADDVLIQTIHTKRGYNRPGNETPLVFEFGSFWLPDDPALVELQLASRSRTLRACRLTFPDTTVGVFSGYPSASMVPNGSAGAPVTTPVKINARGWFQPYPAP